MSLISFPVELLQHVGSYVVPDAQALSRLLLTCTYIHDALYTVLYQDIRCKNDRLGARCCRTLASRTELCKHVKSFAVSGPDTIARDNTVPSVSVQGFTRDFTTCLQQMSNLEYLNCDVAHCSLEVALTLCEGSFTHLHSLIIRFDDTSLTLPFRTFQQLGRLGMAHLPNLKRFVVRDNARKFNPSLFIDGVVNSQRNDLEELMLNCRDNTITSLRRAASSWSFLKTLAISYTLFNVNVLSQMPYIRELTIVRDARILSAPLLPDLLPNLEHIGCSAVNLSVFLPATATINARPIRSVQLNGASLAGAYDEASCTPFLVTVLHGLASLRFSRVPVEDLKLALRFDDLQLFVARTGLQLADVALRLRHLVLVIVDANYHLPVDNSTVYLPTNLPTLTHIGDAFVQRFLELRSLSFPNGALLDMHTKTKAMDAYTARVHALELEKWSNHCPTLEHAVLGREYTWHKGPEGWTRVDAVYEYNDSECRYFDF